MTDNTHVAAKVPATLTDRTKNSLKALSTALGVAVVGAVSSFISNPTTAHELASVVPLPLQPYVPIVLGAAATAATWFVKNHPLPGA